MVDGSDPSAPAPEPAAPVASAAPQGRSWRERWMRAPVVAFAGLTILFVVVWWDARSEVARLRADMAARLKEDEELTRKARDAARDAESRVREGLARMTALEARITESQSQQAALEALYQDLSRNRDEWALAEIEQTLVLAAQQLQLAGNVRGALLALQNADARLGRADRAQFIAVRRVLQRDIERLKALPQVDTAGLAIRLDALIAGVDTLPLVFDEKLQPQAGRPARPPQSGAPAPSGTEAPAPSLWQRLREDAWDQFRQLVRIRDIDNADPVLLNPSQAFFLRENLKLRLLNARIALLQRNEALFRQDLGSASTWMTRYFDVRSRAGAAALSTLNALSASAVSIELPTLADSLNAVRNFKAPARAAGR
jgi:uroporphyrin-3 C-methyltransferase/uroporphyrinogen III methyltransferase/synthase